MCCVKLSPARAPFSRECHKIYDAWPPSCIYALCPAVVLHLVLFYLPTHTYTHVVVEYVLASFHNTAFIYVIFGPGSFCVFYLLQKSTLSLYLRMFSVSHKLVMIKT